jgi:hypothetical protein
LSADKRPEVLQALQDALGDSDWSARGRWISAAGGNPVRSRQVGAEIGTEETVARVAVQCR